MLHGVMDDVMTIVDIRQNKNRLSRVVSPKSSSYGFTIGHVLLCSDMTYDAAAVHVAVHWQETPFGYAR